MFNDDNAPEGMQLLYAAGTSSEAEVLRQVLAEAGYYMEYVPGDNTGVLGTTGNRSIYVRTEEFDSAKAFLDEYLNAPPLPEDSDVAPAE